MKYQKVPIAISEWSMYQVDTNGIIYSKKGKPLKYSINKKGYCIVNLYDHHKRKGYGVHTLVALSFISNPYNKPTVNHIDGNKQNNNVENLEWATNLEQLYHAKNILGYSNFGNKNVNAKQIYGYDKNTKELRYLFDCASDAARYFATDRGYDVMRHILNIISQVANGKILSYKGCIWSYNKI